jgi:hypothetical protein
MLRAILLSAAFYFIVILNVIKLSVVMISVVVLKHASLLLHPLSYACKFFISLSVLNEIIKRNH